MDSILECAWLTAHLLRFSQDLQATDLDLSHRPEGGISWKIGAADSPIGPDGFRTRISPIWCGIGLYQTREAAESALDDPISYLPFLPAASESWHALLAPISHFGEANCLNLANPGKFVQPGSDPGGSLVVLTTAGFDLGPNLDMERMKDFVRNVLRVQEWMGTFDGLFFRHVFKPAGDPAEDGFTISVWRDDSSMMNFAYRPGIHREQLDRYKSLRTADRASFTRCRPIRTVGTWGGIDPARAVVTQSV
jgi:hypothetical protein